MMTLPVAATKVQTSSIHTSVIRNDIDSAAKYIGAGAATVGVAGAGTFWQKIFYFILLKVKVCLGEKKMSFK